MIDVYYSLAMRFTLRGVLQGDVLGERTSYSQRQSYITIILNDQIPRFKPPMLKAEKYARQLTHQPLPIENTHIERNEGNILSPVCTIIDTYKERRK